MKKLNLQLGSIKEMLSKEQMKKVVGGNDYCGPGEDLCECVSPTSEWISTCVETGRGCRTGGGPCDF